MYEIPPHKRIKKCIYDIDNDPCETEFKLAEEMDQHLRESHNCDKEFKCKDCDTQWVSHLSLELHYVEKHQKIMFGCDICGHVAYEAPIIRRHKQQIHEGKRDYICDICGQGFIQKGLLANHLAQFHDIGECRFKCDTCGKKCKDASDLKTHVEGIHLRDKKYFCDQCPHFSYNIKALQKHIRKRHSNNKN